MIGSLRYVAFYRLGPQVLKYLARYTHRIAISNRRLISMDDQNVTFRWKDYAHHNRPRTMTLDGTEFLRRFLMHAVPRGFMRIRHFGLLANRVRSTNLALTLPATDRNSICGDALRWDTTASIVSDLSVPRTPDSWAQSVVIATDGFVLASGQLCMLPSSFHRTVLRPRCVRLHPGSLDGRAHITPIPPGSQAPINPPACPAIRTVERIRSRMPRSTPDYPRRPHHHSIQSP